MNSGQLRESDEYSDLRPVTVICFLSEVMYRQVTSTGHLRFVLTDSRFNEILTNDFQVHTIELPKYLCHVEVLSQRTELEKLCWFLLHASVREPDELKRLLPEPPFVKSTRSGVAPLEPSITNSC